MLENGHEELPIDLANGASPNFKFMGELAEKGHKHVVAYVHRFGEAGTMGQMDCVYSYWVTRRDEGFGAQGLAALRDLVPVLGLAIKSAAQADIAKTLGRVYLGRDAAEQVLRGKITRGVTERSTRCCGSPTCAARPRSARASSPARSSRSSTIMRRPRSTPSMRPAARC